MSDIGDFKNMVGAFAGSQEAASTAALDQRFIADLARSRTKYPSTTRMFDGLMGEVDELRRAYGGDGDCTAEAFDVAVVAYRIATEGDEGGNVSLAPTAASEQQVSVSEAAITAAMSEGNKHGVNSIVAAHIVAAYTLALSGRATIPSAADEQASIPNWKARRNADRELLRRAGENDRRLPVSGYMLAEIADLRAALTHRTTTATAGGTNWNALIDDIADELEEKANLGLISQFTSLCMEFDRMRAQIAAAPDTATTAADQQGDTASASEPQAGIVGAPLDSYAPKDQAFFKFWYSHMKDEVMQPPLSETWHSTARYIWDAAIAQQYAAQAQDGEMARLWALHAAVSAIYLDDSSDFRSALGSVIRHLDPALAGEVLENPKAAYNKVSAAIAAPATSGGGNG